MTDRLTLTRALEQSGMQSSHAERIATEIYDAIRDNVATKADIRELEQRFDLRFEEIRHLITRMTIALGVVVAAVGGVIHYWK